MNKKKIGAALSVVAAVSAGATAYASTINNLQSDKNTNSMLKPSYSEKAYDYSLVKSDYTRDLKNTSIANEKREAKNTKQTAVQVAKIEKNAVEIVKQTINVQKANESNKETATENIEKSTDDSVVIYDDEKIADIKEEESSQKDSELVTYDDTKLDEELLSQSDKENVETKESEVESSEVVNYLDNNIQAVEEAKEMPSEITQFVNVEALNIRNSKSMEDNSNVVRTIKAGDKLVGTVEGSWLKTNEGFVKLTYLSNTYPQDLVDSITQKAIETRKLEEEKAKEAKKLEEQKAIEAKKLEEQKAIEAKKLEEEKAKEAQKQEEKAKEEVSTQNNEEAPYGPAFTGWVYNTPSVNVRQKAKDGKILGTLQSGTKVVGEIANGWVKTTFNDKVAYVSAYYLTTEEANVTNANQENKAASEKEIAAENNQSEDVEAIEEVVDEEIKDVEEKQAPVTSENGQKIANIASQFAGKPYVWGASDPLVGFDCSGLVTYAYKQLGVNLPHQSQSQFNNGYAVEINSLRPGDLVFFSNSSSLDHVGIVVSSDGTFIHASTPKSGVKYDNVYSNYYQKTFAGARRIF